MESEQRGCTIQLKEGTNRQREESLTKAKPFCISQREVVDAFKQVKANRGQRVLTGNRLRSSRLISRTICTNSGTGCPPGATFLLQYAG
jgi:hypothetical protein